jgi:hypothetical protein
MGVLGFLLISDGQDMVNGEVEYGRMNARTQKDLEGSGPPERVDWSGLELVRPSNLPKLGCQSVERAPCR